MTGALQGELAGSITGLSDGGSPTDFSVSAIFSLRTVWLTEGTPHSQGVCNAGKKAIGFILLVPPIRVMRVPCTLVKILVARSGCWNAGKNSTELVEIKPRFVDPSIPYLLNRV